jgi:Fe-S cluster assembly protein SufD
LEIYADDVKCTHGATTGQLDPQALFYLRSRGLPEKAARSLLIYAFARELVDRIAVKPLADGMADYLTAWLPQAELVREVYGS